MIKKVFSWLVLLCVLSTVPVTASSSITYERWNRWKLSLCRGRIGWGHVLEFPYPALLCPLSLEQLWGVRVEPVLYFSVPFSQRQSWVGVNV